MWYSIIYTQGNSNWYDFHAILMGQQVNKNDWDIWAISEVKSFLKESFKTHSDSKSSNIKKIIVKKIMKLSPGKIFSPHIVSKIFVADTNYNSGPTLHFFGKFPIPISGGRQIMPTYKIVPTKILDIPANEEKMDLYEKNLLNISFIETMKRFYRKHKGQAWEYLPLHH